MGEQNGTQPLWVYFVHHDKPSACLYYRVDLPARGLTELGLAKCMKDDKSMTRTDRVQSMFSSDLISFFAVGGDDANRLIYSARQMRPGLTDDGSGLVYPPAFTFDMDDNLDWVHPFNPAFVRLGTRAYDGQLLKPGESLYTIFPDGSEVPVWEDQKTVSEGVLFDVTRNYATIQGVHETAKLVDGVTVPSLHLADYYRKTVGAENVYVFPNSVCPEDYPQVELQPHKEIRILWQGGASHMIDWFPLRDAVRDVALRYPNVKFVIWGTAYAWIHENIPKEQLELLSWVEYPGYRPSRVLVDADINLCPLEDTEFNRSKSCIKWYEASILRRPEPTLAGRVRPYTDEMEDGKTGLLYSTPEEFVEKLCALIESAELRRTLAENAKQWVIANRHFLKTTPGLFEFYKEIRERKCVALEA